MTFILNPRSIAEAKSIGLPDDLLRRWNQALQNNRLIEWKELSIWLSLEARLAWANRGVLLTSDLVTLSDVAYRMQLDCQPVREAA